MKLEDPDVDQIAEEWAASEDRSERAGPSWPELPREALHGVAGEIVSILDPHTEADPVAILMHLLVSFGSMVGRGPHFVVGGTMHYSNLACIHVGATASRKGTAKDATFFVLRTVDPEWMDSRVQSGLSSGEGLIWAVRDQIEEQQAIKEKGRVVDYQMVVTDPGVHDKRLLLIEPEFGSTLRVLDRDGNSLSGQIRQAWDSGNIRVLTKNKAARASDAHVSVLGHVTQDELLKYLNETEKANGFGNRMLWILVRRSKLLPDGGELRLLDLGPIRDRLARASNVARPMGEMQRSPAAREAWHAVYPKLAGDRLGLFGAMTNRAEAQTMRLALIYALLDRSSTIEIDHLNAALAVWSYAERSAKIIFGDAMGDSTADEVLKALRSNPQGMTKTDLSNHFRRNKPASEISRAIALLLRHGKVRSEREESGGRPTERFLAE